MKNWFGIEPHYTDRFIHWSEFRGRNGEKEVLAKAERLRAVYDRLVAVASKEDLDEIIEAAWKEGYEDGYESGYDYGAEI